MRCGMNSLALKVQQGLGRDPHGGEIFCFRGRKGDLIKILWHDGVGTLTQVPTATPLAISSASASAGVLQPRVLRGRSFMSLAM